MGKAKVAVATKKGRPSAYRDEYADLGYRYALLGATNPQMAGYFGVATSTVSLWLRDIPAFSDAVRAGKQEADARVAGCLFQRATGFSWLEEVPIKVKTVLYENGKRLSEVESVVVTQVRKTVPPDATSMIFWLKNRQKETWRDKHEISGDPDQPLVAKIIIQDERQK